MTGSDFFGLHHPSVVRAVEDLPKSRICNQYQRDFDFAKLRFPKNIWPGFQSNFCLFSFYITFLTISFCKVEKKEEEEEVQVNSTGCARTQGIQKETLRRYKKQTKVIYIFIIY